MSERRSSGCSKPDDHRGLLLQGFAAAAPASSGRRPATSPRNRHGRRGRHRDVPPDGAGRASSSTSLRRRSARSSPPERPSRKAAATGSRDRAYEIDSESGDPPAARSEPALPRLESSRATGRVSRRDRREAQAGDRPAADVAQGRADVASLIPSRRAVADFATQHPAPGAHDAGSNDLLLVPEHQQASVRRRPCSTGGQLRPRPRRVGRALRRPPGGAARLSGAAAELSRLPTVLPVHRGGAGGVVPT